MQVSKTCFWMKWFWGVAILAIGCGSSPTGPPVGANLDPKVISDELARLEGTWIYERQVVEGSEVSIEDMQKDTIVIKGNSMLRTVSSKSGERLTPVRSTISVDPTVTPKQIDDDVALPTGRTKRRPGIYQVEADKLTLCYDNTGKQRPSGFESPEGSSLVLTVLRRQTGR
jgi:uncharacterized protein (TIGR03067 family)